MIISASRRTDLPAHYSDWLVDSIVAGQFILKPQSKNLQTVPVNTDDVLVFWTKDPAKMLPRLNEIKNDYYFLFTLNNYP